MRATNPVPDFSHDSLVPGPTSVMVAPGAGEIAIDVRYLGSVVSVVSGR